MASEVHVILSYILLGLTLLSFCVFSVVGLVHKKSIDFPNSYAPLFTLVTADIWIILFLGHKIIGRNRDVEMYGPYASGTLDEYSQFPVTLFTHEHFVSWWDEALTWLLFTFLLVATHFSITFALRERTTAARYIFLACLLSFTNQGMFELQHQEQSERISSKMALVLSIWTIPFFMSACWTYLNVDCSIQMKHIENIRLSSVVFFCLGIVFATATIFRFGTTMDQANFPGVGLEHAPFEEGDSSITWDGSDLQHVFTKTDMDAMEILIGSDYRVTLPEGCSSLERTDNVTVCEYKDKNMAGWLVIPKCDQSTKQACRLFTWTGVLGFVGFSFFNVHVILQTIVLSQLYTTTCKRFLVVFWSLVTNGLLIASSITFFGAMDKLNTGMGGAIVKKTSPPLDILTCDTPMCVAPFQNAFGCVAMAILFLSMQIFFETRSEEQVGKKLRYIIETPEYLNQKIVF